MTSATQNNWHAKSFSTVIEASLDRQAGQWAWGGRGTGLGQFWLLCLEFCNEHETPHCHKYSSSFYMYLRKMMQGAQGPGFGGGGGGGVRGVDGSGTHSDFPNLRHV